MNLTRNGDDLRLEVGARLPFQRLGQGRTIGWRIPLHHDQFDPETATLRLFGQASNEQLHAGKQVAAVLVVARGRDDAELWSHAPALAFSSPVLRHRVQ